MSEPIAPVGSDPVESARRHCNVVMADLGGCGQALLSVIEGTDRVWTDEDDGLLWVLRGVVRQIEEATAAHEAVESARLHAQKQIAALA
jgi:hypothetical protein